MNVQAIIEPAQFKEWVEKNITFEPRNEWMTGGNINQRCAIMFEGISIGVECSYFPHNIFKDPVHWQYVTEEVNITPSNDFKAFYKMEQDPYAKENHYPRWKNIDAAVLYWLTKNKMEVVDKLCEECSTH